MALHLEGYGAMRTWVSTMSVSRLNLFKTLPGSTLPYVSTVHRVARYALSVPVTAQHDTVDQYLHHALRQYKILYAIYISTRRWYQTWRSRAVGRYQKGSYRKTP